MAARPLLGSEEPVYPLRVCALGVDALAAAAVQAALREDPRLACVDDPAQADVIVWDAGPGQEVVPPGELLSDKPWIALVPDAALAPALLAHGAHGVLARRAHAPSLAAAVVAVRLGLCVLDLSVAEPCLHGHEPESLERGAAGRRETVDALTSREREVLEALALGLSNRVIAERLGVSVHTVKFHVNAILAKLQVESRAGAVARALRSGLLRA